MDNWIWGLSLIALTLAIHATSMTLMAAVLYRYRLRLRGRTASLAHAIANVIGTITTAGMLLATLHIMEAALWAAVYVWLGAFGSLKDAMLYSIDSIATRGASGLTVLPHWQMLGALEAVNGVLLFGISTAFIFTVMQYYYQDLVFRVWPDGSPKAD